MSEAGEPGREAASGPLARAQAAREDLLRRQAEVSPPIEPAVGDPLRYCIWTTIALLAWLLTPAVLLAWFGSVGFVRYRRAWRAGLRRTDCWLRDPRWAMAYLGALAAAGVAWTAWKLLAR